MGLPDLSKDKRPSYNVVAERAGSTWFISVPSVPGALASTRRHDQIEGIARVVIAQALDVPQDSFDVNVNAQTP